MNTIQQQPLQSPKTVRFFDLRSDLFTGSTQIFFQQIVIDDDIENWWKGEVENTIDMYPDPAEQVHRLSELIRIECVETSLPEADKLSNSSYKEILLDGINECDCYSIAKELIRQYREKKAN